MIAWGFLYLSMANAMHNLEESIQSGQSELIYIRQIEFKKQLNLYRKAALKRRKEKRAGNALSYNESIFIKKLKFIENRAEPLFKNAASVLKSIGYDKI